MPDPQASEDYRLDAATLLECAQPLAEAVAELDGDSILRSEGNANEAIEKMRELWKAIEHGLHRRGMN